MSETESNFPPDSSNHPWWRQIPVTLQIAIALLLAVILGIVLSWIKPSNSLPCASAPLPPCDLNCKLGV